MSTLKNDPLLQFFRHSKRSSLTLVAILVLIKLTMHLWTAGNYQLHRDAYLYLAMADHLDVSFLSVPPLIGFNAWLLEIISGQARLAVALSAVFPGCVIIIVMSALIDKLGGGKWAILIAGVSFLFSVAFLRVSSLFQPVGYNQMFWMILIFYWVTYLLEGRDRDLYVSALVAALAFWNKYSIVFFVVALLAGLLLTNLRHRIFRRQALWAAAFGLLLVTPILIWQQLHHWPVIHHLDELRRTQLVNVSASGFLIAQLQMNGHALLIWGAGLYYLLRQRQNPALQSIGYTYLALLIILLALSGKAYYTLGIYPVLFAAGAVAVERFLAQRRTAWKIALLVLIIVSAMPLLPFGLPLLKPQQMAAYGKVVANYGFSGLLYWEDGRRYDLPQDFADMIGWEEIADAVRVSYQQVEQQEGSAPFLFAGSYGMAGAIRYYDRQKRLPEAVSFSDTYLLWAPDTLRPDQKVWLYVDDVLPETITAAFEDVTAVWTLDYPLSRQHGTTIYLCRKIRPEMTSGYRQIVAGYKNIYGQGRGYPGTE